MNKPKKQASGPALVIKTKVGAQAWWSKSAPGQPGYVEPLITPDTKVTICPSFSDHPRWSNTHARAS